MKLIYVKYHNKSASLKSGDKVKIRKGKFSGQTSRVIQINRRNKRVFLDLKINNSKQQEIYKSFSHSNLEKI
jgi:ribosomal protein L24